MVAGHARPLLGDGRRVVNPVTDADLAAVRRLIETRVPPQEQQDWLEALGLAPYEAPGHNPEAFNHRGVGTRTRTVVRSGL